MLRAEKYAEFGTLNASNRNSSYEPSVTENSVKMDLSIRPPVLVAHPLQEALLSGCPVLRFNCRSPNFSQARRKSTDIRSRTRPPLKLMCNICRSVWR